MTERAVGGDRRRVNFGVKEWLALAVLFAGLLFDYAKDRETIIKLDKSVELNTKLSGDLDRRVLRIEETRYTSVDAANDRAIIRSEIQELQSIVMENTILIRGMSAKIDDYIKNGTR